MAPDDQSRRLIGEYRASYRGTIERGADSHVSDSGGTTRSPCMYLVSNLYDVSDLYYLSQDRIDRIDSIDSI